MLAEDGLGVELHAFAGRGRAGQLAVAHAHDLAVLAARGDLQYRRAARLLDDEGVVADHAELARQTAEHAALVGRDGAGLAVHLALRADDPAAQGLAHGLVAQAHAQHRLFAEEMPDGIHAHAGLVGRAGAGREHDVVGVQRGHLGHGDLVIAHDLHVGAQFTEVLDDVEREAVVVVNHEQHVRTLLPRVQRRATRRGLSPPSLAIPVRARSPPRCRRPPARRACRPSRCRCGWQ
mmetsp:Transcript_20777/g.79652  ORF Transcript_20777/g.79652 Transcript_20777/m.79652 type:complete len:235 (-) Transcript_20777:5988-6692(-)